MRKELLLFRTRKLCEGYTNKSMPESPEPTAPERAILIQAALAEVRATQAQIATHREDGTETVNPIAESLRPMNTLPETPAPTAQQRELIQRFIEEYRGYLRAAARRLEPDYQTRHEIYRRLNCAPEDQP